MTHVSEQELLDLLATFGFEMKERHSAQHRIRLQSDDTFIDVWNGKRGVSIAYYNPISCRLKYILNRAKKIEDVEDAMAWEKSIKHI